MTLNKKEQYAILIGIYLARAGRGKLLDISANLKLSMSFLEQVARLMRIGNVIKSVRGPGGGYELIGSPTIGRILKSVGMEVAIDKAEYDKYRGSLAVEDRALALFSEHLTYSIKGVLALSVHEVGSGLVDNESSIFESAPQCSMDS